MQKRFLTILCTLCLSLSFVAPLHAQILSPSASIPTLGADDWEFFVLNGEEYLVVANESDDGQVYAIDSVVYRWNGTEWFAFQAIPTDRASDWEFFEQDGESYLAYASTDSRIEDEIYSMIYRWDGFRFVDHQQIATRGANGVESFVIDGSRYVIFAESGNQTGTADFSWLSRWENGFINGYQQIPTTSADDFRYFEIGADRFLAVADGPDGLDCATTQPEQSRILRWDGSQFVDFQPLASNNGTSVDFVVADGTPLLVISNAGCSGTDVTDAMIYAWDGSAFQVLQTISTVSSLHAEFFVAHGRAHLALSNRSDTDGDGDFESLLYQWNGTAFDLVEEFDAGSAYGFRAFEMDGVEYLAVANNFEAGSKRTLSSIYEVASPDAPFVLSVLDVPNDQGRAVRLEVSASGRDVVGSPTPILQYEIYRQIDPLLRSAEDGSSKIESARALGMLSDPAILASGWDYVGAFPAHGETDYAAIAPTLADSTIDGGLTESTFFVRAATAEPATFFDSPAASGYSVDNLAPTTPSGILLDRDPATGTTVRWQENEEEDLRSYRIYRGDAHDFDVATAEFLGETTNTSFVDPTDIFAYYKVAAVDLSGNEGPAAGITGTSTAPARTRLLALQGNTPNPFNPKTTIRFTLGRDAPVTVRIFDVRGRLVDVPVDAIVRPAGKNDLVWDGTDIAGEPVVSGVYSYQVEAAGEIASGRMVLVK